MIDVGCVFNMSTNGETDMNFTQAAELVTAMVQYNMSLPVDAPDDERLCPYLEGEPGGGKTSIAHKVAKDLGIPICRLKH